MATLNMIDTTKAFTLMAYSRGRITIPEMVELASSQAMPELLNQVEGTKSQCAKRVP